MEMRHLTGVVPLEEIPALVRAVGYYPSEDEVVNMINEVITSHSAELVLWLTSYTAHSVALSVGAIQTVCSDRGDAGLHRIR